MSMNGVISTLGELATAGGETITATNTEGLPLAEFVKSVLTQNGYTELTSATGTAAGWVKTASGAVPAGSAAATAAVGETVAPTASMAVSGGGTAATATIWSESFALSASGVGEAVGTLASCAPAAAVAGILSAVGFAGGFYIGSEFVERHFDEVDALVKRVGKFGEGVKCYIDEAGHTFMNSEFVQGILDLLIDDGLLDDDAVKGHDINVPSGSAPVQASYYSLRETAEIACELLISACLSSGASQTDWHDAIEQLKDYVYNNQYWDYYDDTKVGEVYLELVTSGSSRFASYRFRGFSTDMVTSTSGELVFPPSSTLEYVYLDVCDYMRTDSAPWQGNEHGFLQIPNAAFRALGEVLTIIGTTYFAIQITNIGSVNTLRVPKQQGATYPTTGDIATDYPDWYGDSVYTGDVINPDGTISRERDIPIGVVLDPTGVLAQDDAQEGVIEGEAEAVNDFADSIGDDIIIEADPPIPPPPIPTLPIGVTPPIPDPTNGASTGMVHIYNPTLAQLSAFSSWLWTGNPFENFSKLLQDPMQAIIGLNLLYATPTRALAPTNIVVGNIDSQCPSYYVTEQYIDINCGSVLVNKYFNNVLDYINTEIQLYLPFIGIVNLSQKEIVGHTVSVKYKVDVLTGTCIALVYVGNQLLYTYSGNCAIQLPLTGANYNSIFSTLAGVIGAGITGFTLGGPVGAIGGAIGTGLANVAGGGIKHEVQRSGNIGANAGAMGEKKPYLIITRNKPYNPTHYNKYYGYPSNETVKLNQCSGYTRVKDIRLHDIYTYDGDAKVVATDSELAIIESKLKGGIIL